MLSFARPAARSAAARPAVARPAARAFALVGSLVAGALALSACGAPSAASPSSSSSAGPIPVVASTNVYGDIVKQIGGDKVSVASIVSKASQDPHSYEATSQDRVAVSKAKLVVLNGHGYDDFMVKLANEAKLSGDSLLNAVEESGLHHDGASPSAGAGASAAAKDDFNEHIWYSQDAMTKVAEAIAAKLGKLDPADAQSFKDRAAQWEGKLSGITSKLAAIKAAHHGEGVAITEPVPLYMLETAGLENKTPEEFSAASEAGDDVPPAALKGMQDLISSHAVKLLAFNPQTETQQILALKKFAEDAKLPVVDFYETMPEGSDYVGWMTSNADALAKALGGAN
ncbi:metal ABC transporter solute-binding protein, Zn/Mn family [Sinomonas sp. ASV322]|uniref:metal ABC transporter solute-binding protein, Zn/Mn family n=1 Tax=Sinomonas sp. ASV322 TaxID=3041920 RepID=UPI0027DBF626|nr:zinc ABC transporter substrate-binding protein [Sinomonas sp. ASV322]MDQ4502019.1 zinc ABC transporter substrate-binding protein [Sinomonas sp. ASV322]